MSSPIEPKVIRLARERMLRTQKATTPTKLTIPVRGSTTKTVKTMKTVKPRLKSSHR